VRRLHLLVPALCLAAAGSEPLAQQTAPNRRTLPAKALSEHGPREDASRTGSPAPDAQGFESIVKPFLAENCYTCHGSRRQKSGLDLQAFQSATALIEARDRWEEVVSKLQRGEMPPEEEPQPPEEARQAVASWLLREFDRIDDATPPDPGRVTARRLNRAEYNNTVRDLLGVDLKPAEDFPQDDSGYGFDNIGDVLSLSPVLMEKYVRAADTVARTAVFGPPPLEPTLTRLRSDGRRLGEAQSAPAAYDVTGLSLPNAFHAVHRFPVDGEYVIRVVLGGVRPAASEPITVALWIDGRQVQTLTHDPEKQASFADDRQDFSGQAREFRWRFRAGERWVSVAIPRIYEGLPVRYGGPNPSMRPEPPPPEFKPPPEATPERLERLRKRFEERQAELAKIPADAVRVSVIEVAGPYACERGPSRESLSRIYSCGHVPRHRPVRHQSWCATRIVSDLARRAYRRPVSSAEVTRLGSLVDMVRKHGDSFDEGLVVAIQAMLVSPDFLFRVERDRPGPADAVHAISQHELATRLSYFLWSSMPDAPLRRAADRRLLRNPSVLEAEVRRMLRDPKARTLAEHFGGQWLQFRALESITRDRDRFPEFEDYLRLSMRRETELLFEHIVREDRSILDFIDARYTFVNERLARHYGLSGVSGPEFRRVDLANTPRGGVLTHGSVLTVSSYATRTSPVLRGKWILDNLLDAPPPQPPPDVPNLDESAIGTSTSMREQLEAHRTNPICASCHRRMDPLGFGLENFDAVGAWRTMDGKFPVEATGTLPGGRSFDGPDELRAILKTEREAFSRCLTTKLLTYALGRGLERYDKRTVKLIASRLPEHGYTFSGLVLEIVNSLPFQMRRGAPAP
jgi:mono/diheme cytochrome c family protein